MERRQLLEKMIAKTYNKVALGVFITSVIATLLGKVFTGVFIGITTKGFLGIWFLMMIVLALLTKSMGKEIERRNPSGANKYFYLVTVAFGVWLAFPFAVYSLTVIGISLFITTVIFLLLSRYGINTKKDVASWGVALNRALWIVIGASLLVIILGIFFNMTWIMMLINIAVIIIFTMYIVHDSNKIIQVLPKIQTEEDVELYSTLIGTQLYLDFINLFVRIMEIVQRFSGNNK